MYSLSQYLLLQRRKILWNNSWKYCRKCKKEKLPPFTKEKKFRSCCLKYIFVFCLFLWTPFLPNFSKRSKQRCCWVTEHNSFPSGGINDLHFGGHRISGWRPWQAVSMLLSGVWPLGACWPVTTRRFPMGARVPACNLPSLHFGVFLCFPFQYFPLTRVFPLSDSPAAGPAAARPHSGGRTACGSTRNTSGWTTIWGR